MQDTLERSAREKMLELFPMIKLMAESTTCKRKGVGCAIIEINIDKYHPAVNTTPFTVFHAINGHSGDGAGNVCQNIVGGCGCAHSEPRAIMTCLKWQIGKVTYLPPENIKRILLTTYSACVNCANIIIDSGIIDAVAYEIHADYWNKPPRNADKIIEAKLPHWTKAEIINDIYARNIKAIL